MEPNQELLEPNQELLEPNQDINTNTIDNYIKKIKISNTEKVESLFKPNSEGYSDFVSREEIDKSELKFTLNGNCRNGAYFGVLDNNKIIKCFR